MIDGRAAFSISNFYPICCCSVCVTLHLSCLHTIHSCLLSHLMGPCVSSLRRVWGPGCCVCVWLACCSRWHASCCCAPSAIPSTFHGRRRSSLVARQKFVCKMCLLRLSFNTATGFTDSRRVCEQFASRVGVQASGGRGCRHEDTPPRSAKSSYAPRAAAVNVAHPPHGNTAVRNICLS